MRNHRKLAWGIAFAFAAAAASAAKAQVPDPSPSAGWVVDESGDTCAMARPLAGPPAAMLVVRTIPGSQEYDVMFVAPSWPRMQEKDRMILRLTGTAEEYSHFPSVVRLGEGRQGLTFTGTPATFLEAFARTGEMTIDIGRRRISYALPRTAAVTRAFRECEVAKLTDWGADPAGLAPGSRPARTIGSLNPLWVDAIPRGRRPLSSAFRLDVDAEGRTTRCTVLHSTSEAFGATVCPRLVAGARFEPARNPAGNAVRSVVVKRIYVVIRRHYSSSPL
ncbi:hypothetical protein [Allosphingosinicella sp.]|uniref:hypothetical protein n=1 Tax=Allosphingosinicella sp. TaxID=2823234 RepID=UPI002F0E4FDC